MKKLFTLLALSLVMVACNKEDADIIMFDWDEVIAEMNVTELSAMDVLKSLQDNECWDDEISYSYFSKDGEIVEFEIGGGNSSSGVKTTIRFVDDLMYSYYSVTPVSGRLEYEVKESDESIKFLSEGVEDFEWKIIAYDENKLLIETYNIAEKEGNINLGEYLYSKSILIRKVDNTKWWEKVIQDEE